MPRITRIEIRDFGGIREFAVDVPETGMLLTGGNRKGKTTVLRALSAALEAEGIDPGAIRRGADDAEIFVDITAVGRVRQRIGASGGDLTIRNELGDLKAKPRTLLRELFGRRLDALAFYLAKDVERQKIVMEAMPCAVTAADLDRWLGAEPRPLVDLGKHGVLVVKELRDVLYERRRLANATAAEARRASDALTAQLGPSTIDAHVPNVVTATAELERARDLYSNLQGQRKAAALAQERAGVVAKKADEHRGAALHAGEEEQRAVERYAAVVRDLVRDLGDGDDFLPDSTEYTRIEGSLEEALGMMRVARSSSAKRDTENAAAASLEASVASAATVTNEALDEAAEAVARAEVVRDRAVAAVEYAKRARALADATALTARAARAAEDLDVIVGRLTADAPRELMARAETIPGFDPGAMTLDGVALDRLSGAEQLGFAVALAKRTSPKSKLLICDGLERLDPDTERDFLAMATAGGWQLIATRVTAGGLEVEAIGDGET